MGLLHPHHLRSRFARMGLILIGERFRTRFPNWHRYLGRVQVGVVLLLVTPSGLSMAYHAAAGPIAAVGLAALAVATATCISLGLQSAMTPALRGSSPVDVSLFCLVMFRRRAQDDRRAGHHHRHDCPLGRPGRGLGDSGSCHSLFSSYANGPARRAPQDHHPLVIPSSCPEIDSSARRTSRGVSDFRNRTLPPTQHPFIPPA